MKGKERNASVLCYLREERVTGGLRDCSCPGYGTGVRIWTQPLAAATCRNRLAMSLLKCLRFHNFCISDLSCLED